MDWHDVAKAACVAAEEQGEWAGAPLPIESYPLVVAPSYSFQGLNGFKMSPDEELAEYPELPNECDSSFSEIVDALNPEWLNSWWCPARGGYVHVFRVAGKSRAMIDWDYSQRSAKTLNRAFAGFEAATVLDADAELMAQDKLKSLIKPHLFNGYLLHGMILETSPRSNVTYLLRKGRPTIALASTPEGGMKMLCCLCMHPIGYYQGTFVGCMVPTDEVIAHLILIRAKEEFFWRKANQHPVWAWEAGM